MPTKGLYVELDGGDGFKIRQDADLQSSNVQIDGVVFQAYGIQAIASEDIPAFKCIYINSANSIGIADSQIPGKSPCEGIVTSSALTSTQAFAQRLGEVKNTTWNYPAGSRMFLGNSGNITNVPPNSGTIQQIGSMKETNTLVLELKQIIRRS